MISAEVYFVFAQAQVQGDLECHLTSGRVFLVNDQNSCTLVSKVSLHLVCCAIAKSSLVLKYTVVH